MQISKISAAMLPFKGASYSKDEKTQQSIKYLSDSNPRTEAAFDVNMRMLDSLANKCKNNVIVKVEYGCIDGHGNISAKIKKGEETREITAIIEPYQEETMGETISDFFNKAELKIID